jgi:hypothetical protein
LLPTDFFTMRETRVGRNEVINNFINEMSGIIRVKFVPKVTNLADEPNARSTGVIQENAFFINYLLEQSPQKLRVCSTTRTLKSGERYEGARFKRSLKGFRESGQSFCKKRKALSTISVHTCEPIGCCLARRVLW